MSSGSHPLRIGGDRPEDRRKDRRYEVELNGELRYDGWAYAVQISDISGSGALVFTEDPPPAGTEAELWIEGFGILPIEIMHAGEHVCGVAIINAAAYRDQLMEWLRQEVDSEMPAAAAG